MERILCRNRITIRLYTVIKVLSSERRCDVGFLKVSHAFWHNQERIYYSFSTGPPTSWERITLMTFQGRRSSCNQSSKRLVSGHQIGSVLKKREDHMKLCSKCPSRTSCFPLDVQIKLRIGVYPNIVEDSEIVLQKTIVSQNHLGRLVRPPFWWKRWRINK